MSATPRVGAAMTMEDRVKTLEDNFDRFYGVHDGNHCRVEGF